MVENKSVEKPKRQRTQKQIDAFEKARAKRSENLANKKKPPELTKEEKKEIKDYNKGFNIKTDKTPKIVETDNANVVSTADYDPFSAENKKNGVGQPPAKKKELEVEYIDPPPKPKPKRQYNRKPAPLPTVEEESTDDDDIWVDSSEEEVEPVKLKPKPKPKIKATPKPKKKPKIVYESESSEEEEIIVKKKKPTQKKTVDYSSNLSLKDKLRLNGF